MGPAARFDVINATVRSADGTLMTAGNSRYGERRRGNMAAGPQPARSDQAAWANDPVTLRSVYTSELHRIATRIPLLSAPDTAAG